MVEFWYAATGPMHWLKLHETHMQSQDFFLKATMPNGQMMQQQMKGILEPIMLYRFIVPEDGLPIVANTLNRNGSEIPNNLNMQAWALRKALKLDKIPNYPPTNAKMPVSMDNLQIIPIGIKTDPERILSTGVKQETV